MWEVGDISRFDNSKQLQKLAGYAIQQLNPVTIRERPAALPQRNGYTKGHIKRNQRRFILCTHTPLFSYLIQRNIQTEGSFI